MTDLYLGFKDKQAQDIKASKQRLDEAEKNFKKVSDDAYKESELQKRRYADYLLAKDKLKDLLGREKSLLEQKEAEERVAVFESASQGIQSLSGKFNKLKKDLNKVFTPYHQKSKKNNKRSNANINGSKEDAEGNSQVNAQIEYQEEAHTSQALRVDTQSAKSKADNKENFFSIQFQEQQWLYALAKARKSLEQKKTISPSKKSETP